MEQTNNSPQKKKKWSWSPRRHQSSKASRAPQAAEARGHDARGLRSDLGSGRKKGVGFGVSSTKLRSQLANARSAEESRGLGAPGPRQPGKESPRWASYAARRPRGARALWRPRSLPRSPARPLARLSAALSAAAAAAAPSRRVTPPLKPEPFPGRRRPLCQSAPRAPAPRLGAAPDACERPRDPGGEGEGARAAPGRGGAAGSILRECGRGPRSLSSLGSSPDPRFAGWLHYVVSFQVKTTDRKPALCPPPPHATRL